MKNLRHLILLMALLLGLRAAHAEDVDLFLTPPSAVIRPNVLIIVDNTANWSRSFQSEMNALASVVATLGDNINVGIMMFTESGGSNGTPDGGYVRSAIRQMNTTNKTALVNLVNSLHVNNDKSNGSKFSLAMMEAYQYFKGLPAYAGFNKVKKDPAAFIGTSSTYQTPLGDACQKNFIIVLSNGPAGDNTSDGTVAKTNLATAAGFVSGTFPPEIVLNPNQEQSVWSDEWARFMSNTDVSSLTGNQNIITYTIDVVNTNNETLSWRAHSAQLQSMAKNGESRGYFKISDAQENAATTAAITEALAKIFTQIQAVDSVFATSTLPVSVNVRGTYLNQVYMGVFRPDANASPRWFGNLKQYKLAVDNSGGLFLADVNSAPIEDPTYGFVNSTATSIWTSSSNYWGFKYGSEPSDSPDGSKVEKGGAAQKLRNALATDTSGRVLYTCTGTCTDNTSLSVTDTLFNNANANITSAALGAANATERTNIINWVRGADNIDDENSNGNVDEVRPSVHGDVLHSRPAVVNYNRAGQPADRDIYVFYGGNDGIFHAIKGGNNIADGTPAWGFIPSEFFGKFKRLRDATTNPDATRISTANPKGYFFDGPIGIRYVDANNDGRFTASDNDKVQIFIGARRGGRMLYALDVSNPLSPTYMWKATQSRTNYGELGFTWSEPRSAKVRIGSETKDVLIFGGGYDPTVDDLDPDRTYTDISSSTSNVGGVDVTTIVTTTTRKQLTADNSSSGQVTTTTTTTTSTVTISNGTISSPVVSTPTVTNTTLNRSMGRALYVVDATNGNVLWRAGRTGSGANLIVSGFDYSIPSDVTILDLNNDGMIDTLYFGDTGGNVWRANFSDTDTANWTVTKLATLGGSAANKRKFLFKPDVVIDDANPGRTILIGSGDREHPFDTAVTNRFYAIQDSGTASNLTESNLADVTSAATSTAASAAVASSNGWYITLATGEKVIGGAITLGQTTFFSTNQPSSVLEEGSCSNLGIALGYAVNYTNGSVPVDALGHQLDNNSDGNITAADRVTNQSVGLPPSPIGISVQIDGKTYETVCQGTHCEKPPSTVVGQRFRVYWHLDIDR